MIELRVLYLFTYAKLLEPVCYRPLETNGKEYIDSNAAADQEYICLNRFPKYLKIF